MRFRFAKKNQRNRMMIRTNSCHDLVELEQSVLDLGYRRLGFVGFIKHCLTRKCPKKDYYGAPIE